MLWDTEVQEAGEHLNPEQSRQGTSQQMETTGSDPGAHAANNTLQGLTGGVGGKEARGHSKATGSCFREGLGFCVSSKR